MTENRTREQKAAHAVESTALVLLCGDGRSVTRTARELFRDFGVISYALIPENCPRPRALARLSSALFLRLLPKAPSDVGLLSETALRFLAVSATEISLPVLIDCTGDARLLSDPSVRDRLECSFFLSGRNEYRSKPPFCYLTKSEVIP